MPLKIVYVLTCRILGLVVILFRSDRAMAAEVLEITPTRAILDAMEIPESKTALLTMDAVSPFHPRI